MKKAEELKARLRRYSFEAGDFSENKNPNTVRKVQYIRLDMALAAIDELEKQNKNESKKGS